METRKKRWGDRKDGYWVRDLGAINAFTPYLLPNRADNEAFIQERIDLTNILAYLDKKNANSPEFKYTIFHVIAAAIVKVFVLRPKMNRFIQGRRVYQRKHLTLAFVVKKQFKDDAHEALAYQTFDGETTIDSVHDQIVREITEFRNETKIDNSTAGMDLLLKFPRFILRFIMWILHKLDFYGKVPDFLAKTDPENASIFISNLGSIKLNAAYHHLNNWSTNSVFIVIGKKHVVPYFEEDGTYNMRNALELGITLDERIADGYYYSRSIALFKHLLENPELLERPAKEEVSF